MHNVRAFIVPGRNDPWAGCGCSAKGKVRDGLCCGVAPMSYTPGVWGGADDACGYHPLCVL
jgi:hypothetical protein